jgi:hypothetical protein
MNGFVKKSLLALTAGATIAGLAAPAEAQRWRRHHRGGGDEAAAAIVGGIIGIGLGAAIASSNRGRYYDPYYDRGYYDRGYYGGGYYDRDYYRGHRGYYRERCYTRRVWDPYWGRRVRVRYCR